MSRNRKPRTRRATVNYADIAAALAEGIAALRKEAATYPPQHVMRGTLAKQARNANHMLDVLMPGGDTPIETRPIRLSRRYN